MKELREEHADYIAQKRSEAHEAVHLLERSVAQSINHERSKSGLSHFGLEQDPALISRTYYYFGAVRSGGQLHGEGDQA